ncbi:hypothetical protein [Niabella aurantiaca]|uniref:hypothetical protein n=1 Tax=Niabella aurantiaca TaxID=379900 RepID=UPI00036BDC3D|nr:hypothetical protein [Niabella aurantiaca]
MLRPAIILLALLLPAFCTSAQAPPDVSDLLQSRLNAYNAQHPRQTLIVIADKNIYAKNEMLWFAGYILSQPESVQDTATVLIATWVDDVTHKVLLQKKFPIRDQISTGNFLVPDSALPGAHHIVFSTNLLHHNQPIGEYRLPVSVKTNAILNYTTALTLPDSLNTPDKIGVGIALVPLVYRQLMQGAKFSYQLKGQKERHIELNRLGKGVVFIDKKWIRTGSDVLYTTTRFEDETYPVNIKLPAAQNADTLSFRFYPEGGNLVYGLESQVACEAKVAGSGVAVTATLLQNEKALCSVPISTDGKGLFTLRPQKGARYLLQAVWNNKNYRFDLLPALDDGVVIKIPTAVVDDSLQIELQSSVPRTISITLHNAATVIGTPPIPVKSSSRILMPVKERKGIYAITVFDDKGRPLAERLIFARYHQKAGVDIIFNKESFGTRDRVDAILNITGAGNQPTSSVLTVSCVAMNRIATDIRKDLESVFYLENELKGISLYDRQGRLMDNRPLLEEALLLKGWRRYTWQQLQHIAGDTAKIVKPNVRGQLFRFEKKIKKPEELVLIKDSILGFGNTDHEGIFFLNENDLLVRDGRKLFIKVMGKNKDGFQYKITDSLVKTTADAAGSLHIDRPVARLRSEDELQDKMDTQERGKTLEAVVVRSQKKFYAYGSNECGDYVCQYGVLNCINHPYPFAMPVVGRTYYTNANGISRRVVYMGCKNGPVINTDYLIYRSREFYGMDSTLMKQGTEEMMSTIYWKPLLYTDATGKLECSFFTADLKGAYLMTVQGISADGSLIFRQKLLRVQ